MLHPVEALKSLLWNMDENGPFWSIYSSWIIYRIKQWFHIIENYLCYAILSYQRVSQSGWWFQPLWKILVSCSHKAGGVLNRQLGWLFPIYGKINYLTSSYPHHDIYVLLLANLLAFYLTYLLAFYLAYLLAFYLANILAFYLAYLLQYILAYLLNSI